MGPNKSLFRHNNPESKLNPETYVILQHKNTNILIFAHILTIFFMHQQCKIVKITQLRLNFGPIFSSMDPDTHLHLYLMTGLDKVQSVYRCNFLEGWGGGGGAGGKIGP